MSDSISISMMLRKPWRSAEGALRVRDIAASLGITVTTSGRASISGKVPPETFKQLFGSEPIIVTPEPPGDRDFGAPGGYISETPLPVPKVLAEYVDDISIVPPARRLW